MKPLFLTEKPLTLSDFHDVVFDLRPVRLAADALRKMNRSRKVIDQAVAEHQVIYGVTTGFGKLASQRIPDQDLRALQVNLIRSHACGVGPPLTPTQTRGILLLRARTLSFGYSGVRPRVVERLIEMLNRSLYPVIPSRGSVGASGDLIPLAHLAGLLIGEGEALYQGKRLSGAAALKAAGLAPMVLEAKEGLSLVNGTQVALSLGLLALISAERLSKTATVAGALSLEALMGTPTAFDPRIHALRPHPGQRQVAATLLALLEKSEIRESHIRCERVQDPYSIRCIPQVHGAVLDAIGYVRGVFTTEMNSVTDNPLVFHEEGEVLAGGNFHGHPIALAADLLAIAITHLGAISERRIAQMIDPQGINLPPFLTRQPGLHCGFMIPQVAAAALVSECKLLSHPASVDSIPTSANQEDYVSMAMGATLKLTQVIANVSAILAIEILAAGQGVEFHRPLKPGVGVASALKRLRAKVPSLAADRSMQAEIETVSEMIQNGAFCP